MTRGAAIEYDLKKSPYRVIESGNTFVFSSELHAQKFRERLREKRELINFSLSNRFNVAICFDIIADIMLYKEIEQRGFLIITEGGECKCLNHILLNGARLTCRRQDRL
ncbi:MAG: hypothetical protein J6Y71_06890 [Ruminococcus sp.]|nr:hypothetical protein [Ruminococcus sp.]